MLSENFFSRSPEPLHVSQNLHFAQYVFLLDNYNKFSKSTFL